MKQAIKQMQRGFTLVELVVVVAITGVLAAVAIPKLVNSSGDARQAALTQVAAKLTSASSLNYSTRAADAAKGVATASCADAALSMQGGLSSSNYTTGEAVQAGTAIEQAAYALTVAATAGRVASTGCVLNSVATPVLSTTFTVYQIS